VTPSKMK